MPSNQEAILRRLVKMESGFPPLFRNHTFKQFVVRPCNSHAFEAARLITSRHGKPELALFPNSLFLHGQDGVGKTHLMAAIAQAIEQNHPETRIRYCFASEFVRDEFSSSLVVDDFDVMRRYECADLLLLEGLEELHNMIRTRQRLYSLLNSFLCAGKTLVLTSDLPPPRMDSPKGGLSNWFDWGLVTEIHPLDRKGRAKLLRNWLGETDNEGLPSISDSGIQFLAETEVADMRELSGLLTRVLLEARLTKGTISVEQIRTLFVASSSS